MGWVSPGAPEQPGTAPAGAHGAREHGGRHMNVWAIAAQKGGVGKTTTAVNVAGALAERGQRVLLVDLDPHVSLSAYFRIDEPRSEATVFALFEAAAGDGAVDPASLVRPTPAPGIALVPGSNALFAVDRRFGARPGMGLVLQRYLPALAADFDYCLLDCSPSLGAVIVNAVACCTRLLVPLQTEYLAVSSLQRMLHTVTLIERRQQLSVPTLVVPTMFDRRTRASVDSLARLRGCDRAPVWPQVIPVDTHLREASRIGLPLTQLRPAARGARAYDALVGDLLASQARPLLRAVG